MNVLGFLVVATAALSAEPASATLRGAVTGTDGKPVTGARVDISSAAPRVGPGLFCPHCYRDCKKGTRTDAAGHFEIAGLDPTLKFMVLVSSPDKKASLTKHIDPGEGDVAVTLDNLPNDVPNERVIRGQVVDDRGRPIAGVLVSPQGAQTAGRRWSGQVRGVDPTASDEDGRFRLFVPAGILGVDVNITGKGYAGEQFKLLKPGAEDHRLTVPAGTRVTGRLVRDGKPAPGVRVAVVQTDRRTENHFIRAVGDVTDSEGKFLFLHLPANQPYVIFTVVGEGPQPLVLTTKRFRAFADREERDLGDLALVAPLRIAGRVEMPAGESLPPNTKIVLGRDPAWDLIAVPVDAEGRFAIDGLPAETYTVSVTARGFEVQPGGVCYQIIRDNDIGIRLRESIENLRIPMVKATRSGGTP